MANAEPCSQCGVMTTGWLVTIPICDPCYDILEKEASSDTPESHGDSGEKPEGPQNPSNN